MPAIPDEVVSALLDAHRHFRNMAGFIEAPHYADPMNRAGVAIDCSCYAEQIENVLERYGIAVNTDSGGAG